MQSIDVLVARRTGEIARMENEYPTERKIMANVWGQNQKIIKAENRMQSFAGKIGQGFVSLT